MKKPKLGGLAKLLLPSVLAIASFGSVKAQDMTYYNTRLNTFSQPNIQMSEGKNKLDFYGSGDVNNNDTINFEDANLIREGNQTGNYRADVDGNGTVNELDAEIIDDYVSGISSKLPSDWNNLNRDEKKDWFTKMLAIDKTDENPYVVGGYECGEFSTQNQINFFGIENFVNWKNYTFFTGKGANNSFFNIPVYNAFTMTTSMYGSSSVAHSINAVLIGEDPLNFNDWYFYESQNDLEVNPGDFSMNKDEYVNIDWYGYYPQYNFFDSGLIVNFDLNNGNPILTNQHSMLILTNPNAPDTISPTANFPENKQVAFAQGMNLESIINQTPPTSVLDNKDPSPVVSYDYISEQTNNGTCSDVSYDVAVNWKIEDNSENEINYAQTISVRDLESPTFALPSDLYLPWEEGIDTSKTGAPKNLEDNSNLEITTSYSDVIESESNLERVLKRTWIAIDVCGNENEGDQYIIRQKSVGIEDKELSSLEFKAYPIPTSDKLNLEYELLNSGKVYTEIYDLSGKLIDYAVEEGVTGENKLDLDVSDLKPGMYLVKISSGENTQFERVIIR